MSSEISNLIFSNLPDLSQTINNIPNRNGQVITRFAPSPTGFLHIGGVYTSLINKMFAMQNDGKFILRIEDTDQNRKIDRGIEQIVEGLAKFDIYSDEGPKVNSNGSISYVGDYGPYIQSERREFYAIFAKYLVENDFAYPCFMTSEELDEIRKIQTLSKQPTGIYGHFAKSRELTFEQIQENINLGKQFVIRLKSPGKPGDRTNFHDLVKGFIEIDDNFEDAVLLKSDGLPTYHFAHIVDDYMMGTTHVIRTDERLPSTPKHIQIYNAFDKIFKRPIWQYCHPSPIMKNDNGNRRKISKRKDPEAKASFFTDVGYPTGAIKDYLLSIIDTKYNDLKSKDIYYKYSDYKIDFANFSTAGAILDMDKLNHFSAEYIYSMSIDQLVTDFAKYIYDFDTNKYDNVETDDLHQYNDSIKLLKNKFQNPSFVEFVKNILSFDRDKKIHKNYLDMVIYILPFIDEYFDKIDINNLLSDFIISADIRQNIKSEYISYLNTIFDEKGIKISKEEWFEDLKSLASKHQIALNNADYKTGGYIAKIGDLAMMLRIYIYGQQNTPDLYNMINILGENEIIKRLDK